MPTLKIHLTDAQQAFVTTEVKNRGLESASAYIAQLILKDQLKPERARIDALLLESLGSPDTPMTEQDWRDIEREGMARLTL